MSLEHAVAAKLILSKQLSDLGKQELILRTAIEDKRKKMLEEIDFNNNLVGYLNDYQDRKKNGVRYMAKLIKELTGDVQETTESKVITTEAKREVDTTKEMECSNCK